MNTIYNGKAISKNLYIAVHAINIFLECHLIRINYINNKVHIVMIVLLVLDGVIEFPTHLPFQARLVQYGRNSIDFLLCVHFKFTNLRHCKM